MRLLTPHQTLAKFTSEDQSWPANFIPTTPGSPVKWSWLGVLPAVLISRMLAQTACLGALHFLRPISTL